MKIAVLGDVHGNLPAFETVMADLERWQPDQIISLGDVINRGPSSAQCLALIQEKLQTAGWRALRGNHEDYILHQAARSGPEFEAFRQSWWTYNQIGCDVSEIARWSDTAEAAAPDGTITRVAHASVINNSLGIAPNTPEDKLIERGGQPPPAVFCAGHIHHAFIRQVNGTIFVNAGSVGMPFDEDWRASYARITWQGGVWDAEIVRLEYDRARAIRNYQDSGFLWEAGPVAWLVLAEQLHARSQLFAWHRDHFDAVRAGERSVEDSVRMQLEGQGLWGEISGYLEK